MRKKSQFIRAILERSSLAMAMMAVLVVVGILLSGTPTASGQAIPANTPATGAPNIIGTAQASETLTVDTSGIADGDGFYRATFSYQWISNNGSTDTDITDETNSTYVIKPWDLGNHIKVRVSFTDKAGNQETLTSAATAAVEASPNEAATGGPIIYGMAEVGQSLGIVSLFGNGWIASIQDGNGMIHATYRYSYQWIRSDGTTDSNIPDATGSSYTLTDDDEGKKIKVRVSFTDDGANYEALTSSASSAVTARPSASALRSPTALSTTWSQEEEGIELSWTAPEGTITGYQILREEGWAFTNIGVWEPYPYGCTPLMEVYVDNTGSDATTYTDTDVAESAVYAYSVRAINEDGVGRKSRDARGLQYRPRHTPTGSYWPHGPPGTPRHAPTNLASIQIGDGIGLTWDAPEGEVTGYQILRRTPEQCEFGYRVYVENTNSAVTRWADRDVEAGTLYEYHIRAINDVGAGSLDRSSSTSLRPAVLVVGPEPNNLATGVPTITGAAQVGETLTADTSGIADADGLYWARFSYQWLSSRDAEIEGATSSTYSLQESDEGKVIKVRVTFTDDVGHEESLTSAPTAAVAANSNSPATGVPTINGTAQVGQTLTVSTSGVSDTDGLANATFTYRWISNDGSTVSDISGATDTTYTLVEADEGKTIKVRVSFTDDRGNQETLISAATGAVAAAPSPLTSTIHNVPSSHNGQNAFTFELRFSEELAPDFSYKALRDDGFTVTGGRVTYVRRLAPPSNMGWEVHVTPDGNGDVNLSLRSTNDCSAQGAICTGEGRKLSEGLQLAVAGPNTPATGAPTISGTLQVGETLTAGTTDISDGDGLGSAIFAYQWLADDAEINGATASTYTLADDDEGKAIRVRVSFTDDGENGEELTSAATGAVAAAPPPPNTPATGLPTISGTARVGETLTAGTTDISDGDGLNSATFAYQWLADDSNISDATNSTYTLADDDEGKTIKVQVTFTDDAGNEETLTSAATAAVEARPNTPATGAPTVSGTVQVGETLTVSTSGIADTDGLTNVSYSYQWIRNDGSTDTDIQDATGSSYTLVDADEGRTIKVKVSFTDDAGHEETLTSAASASVAADPEPLTVSLENNAASHNGTDEFTFQIRFSEQFGLSYKTLRDHAFTVVGGTVKKAQRQVKGSNIGWTITVEPASNAGVRILLPATTDCDATGAICTADGGKLSNSLDFTVVGPGE